MTRIPGMSADEQVKQNNYELHRGIRKDAHRDMMVAVGEVAQASAVVELHLRQLLVTLVDSKYGELVAAGLGAGELIDICTVLLKVNKEIGDEERTEGLGLLSGLKELLNTRNNLVHGIIANHHDRPTAAEDPIIQTVALVSKRRKPMALVTIGQAEAEKTAGELRERGAAIINWAVTHLPAQLNRRQITS
jgi:hypothetical protein